MTDVEQIKELIGILEEYKEYITQNQSFLINEYDGFCNTQGADIAQIYKSAFDTVYSEINQIKVLIDQLIDDLQQDVKELELILTRKVR